MNEFSLLLGLYLCFRHHALLQSGLRLDTPAVHSSLIVRGDSSSFHVLMRRAGLSTPGLPVIRIRLTRKLFGSHIVSMASILFHLVILYNRTYVVGQRRIGIPRHIHRYIATRGLTRSPPALGHTQIFESFTLVCTHRGRDKRIICTLH